MRTVVQTTGETEALQLIGDKTSLKANGEDLVVVTVKANDAKGLTVPTAEENISFTVEGPGKIIGVGNGNSASHEPDKFIESVNSGESQQTAPAVIWKRKRSTDWPRLSYKQQSKRVKSP